MAELKGEIKNLLNITDELASIQDSGKNPILTPVYPNDYQGKQVLLNADRIIFNARKQRSEESKDAANTFEGGDIHMFSHNFISFSSNGSIHLNTLFPQVDQHTNTPNYIMLNSPNIFIGMDTVEGRPKNYPTQNAVLGLKTQETLNKILDIFKQLLDILSDDYSHIGDNGHPTTPKGETFETIRKDWYDSKGEPEANSVGEIRKMIKDIISRHVFIKQ